MARSRAERRLALYAALTSLSSAAAGCTLFEGQPWGEAEVSLAAAFAPPDARVTDEGWLKTSRDYALELEQLVVTFDAVTLSVRADAAAPRSFDPADPPPGYTLCHGEHCHAEDGRLVPYDEIERALAGASAGSVLSLPIRDGAIALGAAPTTLAILPCNDGGCALGRGVLSSLTLAMSAVEVNAIVHDLRAADDARLPPEGVPLLARVSGSSLAAAALEVALDGSEPPGLMLSGVVEITPALFDDVDFGALPGAETAGLMLDDEARTSVLARLSESELSLDVERAPLDRPLMPVLLPLEGAEGR